MAVLIVCFCLNSFDVIHSDAKCEDATDVAAPTEAISLSTASARVKTYVHAEKVEFVDEGTTSEDTATISTEVLDESKKPLYEEEPIDNLDQLVAEETRLAEAKAMIEHKQSESVIPEEEEWEMPEEEPVLTEAYSGGSQSYSDYELQLVARLIAIEAGNQPYDGKVAVGATVVNRKNDPNFPNTIEGVIYAPSQFASLVYSWETVQKDFPDCIDAARDALNGVDPTREHLNGLGNLYFYNPDYCSDYQNQVRASISVTYRIADHVFYAVWD